jgi:NADPH:quinone reductase-like Zn-dependent oxidoreductase
MVVVHEDEALPVPPGLSDVEAAAIPEGFLTAYDALVTRARLAPGERVLIHAVGSGLGTAAIQVARHLGATVLGTSRSVDKLARAAVYGLDQGIDTSGGSFRDRVSEPVHVILDVLGGPAFNDNLAVLAPRGRLVMLGHLAGGKAGEVDLGPVLRKLVEIIGTLMRPRTLEERIPLVRAFTERMIPLFDQRIEHAAPLRAVVERVFPMTELAEAHRLMEKNESFGKLVLTW